MLLGAGKGLKAKHLRISGQVQGVGYRDWMVGEAKRLGLFGWVRNAGGDVEALIYGEIDAVEEMLRHCRQGPRGARVSGIEEEIAEPPEEDAFLRLASSRG